MYSVSFNFSFIFQFYLVLSFLLSLLLLLLLIHYKPIIKSLRLLLVFHICLSTLHSPMVGLHPLLQSLFCTFPISNYRNCLYCFYHCVIKTAAGSASTEGLKEFGCFYTSHPISLITSDGAASC